ncbi:hypothetical protein FCM35_KLT16342 [Carex littledalei]|uniref:Uncharacterized protein n=1 Tax=Carex littledalei TaxID=544730 RepID=A0A833RN34_9POAL|nr:hypothetical protein FCM35_KLT16342 [Carex littledalei]
MDLFKIARFKKAPKTPTKQNVNSNPNPNGTENEIETHNTITTPAMQSNDIEEEEEEHDEDEEEDDFITNEVQRRLKELSKNKFMVAIPEVAGEAGEDDPEAEDEEESSSGTARDKDWLDSADFGFGLEGLNAWLCGFDSLYDKYCQRMLFFDRTIAQLLHQDQGSLNIPRKSPRSSSSANKLASTLRNLSFKRRDQSEDTNPQPDQLDSQPDPYQTLETAYVAQLSLSWEALHCQYAHLKLKISSQPDSCISYSHAAQAFQQFQVLLQRFIETEPFEPGSRVDIYTRSRAHLSKLLQVPNFQGLDREDRARDESEPAVVATDLVKVLEESILTFRLFLKKDKTKSGVLLGAHSTAGSSLHQVQASLDKKEMRVKELFKKKKGWKSKTWPGSSEEVELVFALIDIKVVARVLRMPQLSKEQLLWCEEKMSKIDLSRDSSKLRRDVSPILFPC